MTARAFGKGTRLIKLRGFSGGNTDYQEAKTPASGGSWTYLTDDQAEGWTSSGGWIGAVVPEKRILIDIDDKVIGEYVFNGLKRIGLDFMGIRTPNGYQFLLKDSGRVKKQTNGTLTAGGFNVDYRLAGKGYAVLPTTATEGRAVIHETQADFSPMPAIFIPIKKFDQAKDADKILPIPIYEKTTGRDDTIFRHGCRLRSLNETYHLNLSETEREDILQTINEFFCEPPLSRHQVMQKIQSAERYESADAGDKPKAVVMQKFYPRPFTEQITQQHSFVWEGQRGALWRYNRKRGLWTADGEAFIDQFFRTATAALDNTLKKRNVIAEIVADVSGCSYKEDGLPEPSVNLIPFANGVYDISTGKFRGRTPNDYFTWTLPWNYNPQARSIFLEKLIEDTLPEGDTTLFELMAYCLWRGYPYQKFWLMVGPGSNGKGVFLTILTRLLGAENISGVSLREIQTSHFAAGTLHHRLANVSGEVDYSDLSNTSLLKQLTGGDHIQGDRKYLSPIRFTNHAKLVFATNVVPITRDSTDAFYRRAFLVEFPKTFKQDPTIDVRIRENTEFMTAEFEGLLYEAVNQLRSLVDRRFIFTKDEDTRTVRARYEALSNPLKQFISENCEETYSHKDYIFKFEFRDALNSWLLERRFNSYSNERIKREMAEMGHESGQRGEKKYHSWIGLKWGKSQESQTSQGFINHSYMPKSQFKKGCEPCDSCDSTDTDDAKSETKTAVIATKPENEKQETPTVMCNDCSPERYKMEFCPETTALERNCGGVWCFAK